MKILSIVLLAIGVVVFSRRLWAQEHPAAASTATSVYDFTVKTIDGADKNLAEYKGKVILIVNTASRCGFTPQYTGLEKLYQRYKDRGFIILGFPSNDFLNQEPGDDSAIKQFCELTYKVSFPLFSKIDVKGPEAAPLYRYLTTSAGFNGAITWNFNKFLVNRRGKVVARFGSRTDPMDPQLEEDVLVALAQ